MQERMIAWFAGAVVLARASVARFVEIKAVDRAVALAALAFTALIPLGVVVGALSPTADSNGIVTSLSRKFDLDAKSQDLLAGVFAPPENVRNTFSIIGVFLLIVSALSFTRGLQRVYERSWRLPARGVRGTPAGLQWLLGLVLFFGVVAAVRTWLINTVPTSLGLAVGFSFALIVWLGTPYLLLGRRVPWLSLLPTAILTTTATAILGAASTIWMPRAIADSAAKYGEIGVTIALVSWLVAVGFTIVGCASVGVVVSEVSGLDLPPEPGPTPGETARDG